ncbi:MAG TPA: PH domain-containing protein [Bradyrhizobium sp.]|nr:PH domain-containing protein [Bradyrhizobium sp.]
MFIGWITLLTQLPLQLFFTVWCAGFIGGIAMSTGLFPKSWPITYVIGAVAFFAIPIIAYVGKKLNYSRTEYRFYPDRLEFDEGFFSINKKVIMFRDVKETSLRRGILQRIYGLGSIYLATLATGSTRNTNPFVALGFGNVSASGIIVRDIGDPDSTFEQVRQLVDAQSN